MPNQTIRFINVAKTNDPSIGTGVRANFSNLHQLVIEIANTIQYGTDFIEVSGAQFSCSAIDAAVQRVSPAPDDVVIFYYSGHGWRGNDESNPFPSFACGGPSPNLRTILQNLHRKGAKLTIAVADTCNARAAVESLPQAAPVQNAEAISRLFRDSRGQIGMSSSIPGQYSWYFDDGGAFTKQLIPAILNASPNVDVWRSVVDAAVREMKWDNGGFPVRQTPQAPVFEVSPR